MLQVSAKVAGEQFYFLFDCGASHNFASLRIVQALELPVTDTEEMQVKLPNGNTLTCNTICIIMSNSPAK